MVVANAGGSHGLARVAAKSLPGEAGERSLASAAHDAEQARRCAKRPRCSVGEYARNAGERECDWRCGGRRVVPDAARKRQPVWPVDDRVLALGLVSCTVAEAPHHHHQQRQPGLTTSHPPSIPP